MDAMYQNIFTWNDPWMDNDGGNEICMMFKCCDKVKIRILVILDCGQT
jgi:hypothetical protein